MADLDDEHDQFVILDIADDPVVANPVAPEMAKALALQAFCELLRIIEPHEPFLKKVPDAFADDGVEFLKGFLNRLSVLNRPDHARTPRSL